MYRNTRFTELMKALPRQAVEKVVSEHKADKHSKGFRCWNQLLAMIYAQVSGCQSLRELESGFNSQETHHYHLGCRKIKRSTLSDANKYRSSNVFADVCALLLKRGHKKVKGELSDLLYLLDSTPIPLVGLGYDEWAEAEKDNRIQGLKAHLTIASPSNTPVNLEITEPKIGDLEIGRKTEVERGATYVFDRGYTDYNWWYRLHESGSVFVSRFKRNASLVVESYRPIEAKDEAIILEDAIVCFKNKRPGGARVNHYHGTPLRKITVSRPDKDTPLIIATNDLTRSAEEIAQLYKQRWGIELFFKWIKQHLKIKVFLGRSKNAVKIQIYSAIITYLLVQLYQRNFRQDVSLKMCLMSLRATLFQRVETEWQIEKKRRKKALHYQSMQGALAL